ncbi:MAG TPA: penicillin-binding protein 2 [Acidimicrobiales bacterium]|nr:penicillin-binding protein 2 [Acidimicrobiales bacterium]
MNPQIRRLGLVLLVLFLALFLRLNDLQVLRSERLATAPGNTRTVVRDFSRERGTIQAADGAIVARSVPVDDDFERLREYPEGELFAHISGYFSFTYGTEGVERTYGSDLAGRSVAMKRPSDLFSDRVRTGNVTLTVSKSLQQVARDALGNRKGAVVALNPTDGGVLAMWSFPSFDPTPLAGHDQKAVQARYAELQADQAKPLLPRSYRERYPPGSTFKVVTAAAALEQAPDLVSKDYPRLRTLDLPQTDRDLPNFENSTCGGALSDLLRVSCNTGFAQMGLDMGAEKLSGEAGDFGFGERPPLDLPATRASVFPEAASFARDSPALAKSAIGQQDVSSTPLQMALVAAGVANGGVIMKPHVMAEVRDDEGEVVKTWNPEPWKQAMSPENAGVLRDMMIQVVNSGTGRRAAVPGVQVAGKTGTAQTADDNAHAWMVAFAPAEAPRVAIAVIVESQPGLGDSVTGGRVAAPIVQTVLRAALGAP